VTFAENVAKPDNVWLHTLVAGGRWNTPGEGTEINVYIGNGEQLTFDDGRQFSIDALTPDAVETSAVAQALQLFSNVCDVKFTITNDRDDAQIVFAMTDDKDADRALGWAYFPGDLINPNTGEDQSVVVVNHEAYSDAPQSLSQGGYDFITFIHELGHAMGLDHPHDGVPPFPGVDSPFDDYGLFDMNQGIFTMMTYNDGWNTGPDGASPSPNFGWEGTAMALDVAALQYLYGANQDFATGNDTYLLKNTNEPGTFYTCIWDAGGVDTIRQSGNFDCTIDLRAATLARDFGGGGFVSYVAGIWGGYTIANGAVMENAIGGGGDDVLRGNAAKNALFGGGGEDTIRGGSGSDRIRGDADADSLVGNGGKDQFVYRHLADSTALDQDQIVDFTHGPDKINVRAIDADTTAAGNQAFDFLVAEGADFTHAGQLRFTHVAGSDTLIEATTDNDAEAELSILLKIHVDLTAVDFIL
jgi:serralysin